MTLDFADHFRLALGIQTQRAIDNADPLRGFSFSHNGREHVPQRRFVEFAAQGFETYFRSSNQGGKTWPGAALVVHLARMEETMCGIELPRFNRPPVIWVLSQSWQQQVDAAQAAIEHWLGDWPHKIGWVNRARRQMGVIYVKPRNSNSLDYEDWSRIDFHVEGLGRSLPGGRIDVAWADEPPDMARWNEVRGRGRGPQHPFLKFITATPLERERWEPLAIDFSDCLLSPKYTRVEVRATIEDNPWLTPEYIQNLRDSWRNDPFLQARMTGDYVDISNSSPFFNQFKILQEMERACWPGKIHKSMVQVRRNSEWGRLMDQKLVPWEYWEKYDAREVYHCIIDTGQGINDGTGQTDPSCVHIYARRRPRLVARFNDYESSYNTGAVAAAMGWQYGGPPIEVEMNGGYGDAALDALADSEYHNVTSEIYRDRYGQMATRLGFTFTEANKGLSIGQIQQALESGLVEIPSRGVVGCLMSARLDDHMRLYKPKGVKYEDLVCLGRFLLYHSQVPVQPLLPKQSEHFMEKINETFGRDVFKEPVEGSQDRWTR